MEFFFGKKKAADPAPAPAAPAAPRVDTVAEISKLQAASGQLDKSREMNEKRAQFFLQQAVAYNKKGDKRNAVFAMKRYKMHQGQVEKYNGMQENLLRQIDALQSVAMNKDYLEAIRGGAVAQKELQKDVNVEKVEETREMYEEAMDEHAEVEREMGQVWGNPTGVDESDLMSELDGLMEADLVAGLEAAPAAAAPVAAHGTGAAAAAAPAAMPAMPSVPASAVPAAAAAAAAPARVAAAAGGAGGMDMLAELEGLEA